MIAVGMAAPGVVMIVAVAADRPRPRLLPRLDDPRSCAQITAGLDEVIAGVGEIVEKTAPVNDVVTTINGQLDAGVDALEGLLVKKAGMTDADRPDRRALPGRGRGRACATSPRAPTVEAPRIGEVYTRGTLHAGAARPRGADRRGQPGRAGAAQRRGRQPRGARCSTPRCARRSPEKLPRSPVIGTDAPVQYEQRDDIGAPRKRLPARRP